MSLHKNIKYVNQIESPLVHQKHWFKLFTRNFKGGLKSIYHGKGSYPVGDKLNEYDYRADPRRDEIRVDYNTKYPAGFHCYMDRQQAIERLHGQNTYTTYPTELWVVRPAQVVAIGEECFGDDILQVGVFKYITVIRRIHA